MIVVPFLVLALFFALLLQFSAFGRGVYDIGLNAEAAQFTGVLGRPHQAACCS